MGKRIIVALSSITHATKGHDILDANRIKNKIIKLDASQTTKGCAYGLELFGEAAEVEKIRGMPMSNSHKLLTAQNKRRR